MRLEQKLLIFMVLSGSLLFNNRCLAKTNNGYSNKIKKYNNVVIVDQDIFNSINYYSKGPKRHFLLTTINTETNFRRNLPIGKHGEIGLFQIIPSTKKLIEKKTGYKINLSELSQSVYSANYLLEYIQNEVRDVCPQINMSSDYYIKLLAASYNAGSKYLSKGCKIKKFPKSTQKYVKKFMNNWNKTYIGRDYIKKK